MAGVYCGPVRTDEIDLSDLDADLRFECPRCRGTTKGRFYGPCPACVTELQVAMATESDGPVQPIEYEPKMNVTPNAVALKDH